MRLAIVFLAAGALAASPVQAQTTNESGGPLLELALPNSKKLTVRGELRWRAENRHNYDFRDNAGTNPFFIDQRARLSLDFEVNENVKTRATFQDARTFGEETNTLDRQADGFDLHEGFLDWTCLPESNGVLRLGRQEIALGEQRLVSSLQWATQARTFDGAVFAVDASERVRVTVLGVVVRQDKSTTSNDGAYFTGVYATGETEDGQLEGDAYVLGLFDDGAAAGPRSQRITVGVRGRGHWDDLTVGLELATQTGEVGSADIPFGETFGLHFDVGYTFSDSGWKPKASVEFNYATGNDPSSSDNERFSALFPFAHAYHGYMDFALWENLVHLGFNLQAKPDADTTLKFAFHDFRSQEEGDRFGGPTNVLSTGLVNGDDHMGNEIDLTWREGLGDGIWGELGVGIFLPGDGVRDARGSDDMATFLYWMMGLKF